MKGNSGRKLMAMILFLVLPAVLLATVSVRSATADTVVSTVAVGSGPLAVAVNPVTNKIYTVNNDNVGYRAVRYSVTVIDGVTNKTATVTVGLNPTVLAVNPVTNKIYIVNTNPDLTQPYVNNNGGRTGSVTVIDGATNSTTTVSVGACPCAIAVNPATNKIYVANRDSNTVTVIEGATNSTTTVSVGSGPDAVAVNPATNKIYVANRDSNTMTVIDGADNSTATVNAGSYPFAIAVNSATNKVYVVNNGYANDPVMGTVTVIDGATNQSATVAVGLNPITLVVNSATNKIYVTNDNEDNGTMTVIDGATNSTTTVSVGACPCAIAVNPTTNKIYVVNGTVTIINGATNQTDSIAPGGYAVAVNPTTNKIYVTNVSDNTVTVIDGADTSGGQKSISFTVGQNSYTAGGQSFDMDASPFISNGRALVPVRYLADALGVQTSWNAATRTATLTKGSTTIAMTIGSATLTVNGVTVWLGVAPMIRDGRTFLPVQWVAETFDYAVFWDEATQTVTVLPSST